MTRSRRKPLANLAHHATTHAGLWLDKYLPEQTEKGETSTDEAKAAKPNLLAELGRTSVPDGYPEAIALRRSDLDAVSDRLQGIVGEAVSDGRVALGLGEHTPLEVGLRLERTWGVPYLPGSSLKGLAAATAHKLVEDPSWRRPQVGDDGALLGGGESFRALFGTTDKAGAVRFLDAWWIPERGDARLPIHLDVMTVHHPEYYQHSGGGAPPPPSDRDSPNPVSFASVSGRYLIAVEGPPEWCDAAMALLEHGLRELGLGAKTNAGYGRMRLEWTSSEAKLAALEAQNDAEREAKEAAEARTRELEELASLDVQSRWTRLIAKADSDSSHEYLKAALDRHQSDAPRAASAPADSVDSLDPEGRRVLLTLLVSDSTNPHLSSWKSNRQRARVEAARELGASLDLDTGPSLTGEAAALLERVGSSEACAAAGLTEIFAAMLAGDETWGARLKSYSPPDGVSVEHARELEETLNRITATVDASTRTKKRAVEKLQRKLSAIK